MTTAGVVSDVVSGVVSSVVAGDVGGASPPAGPTLAFHAATFNASTYEMEPQAVGTGTPTFAVDDGLLLPDWEGIYVPISEDTAPWHGARWDAGTAYADDDGGDPLTEAPSLYSAPAMTNLRTYSNDLTNAVWTGGGTTATLNQTGLTGAPNTASLLTATSDTFGYKTSLFGSSIGASTIRVFAGASGSSWLHVLCTAANDWAQFNLNDGTVLRTGGGAVAAEINDLGNGIYECFLQVVGGNGVRFYPKDAPPENDVTPDGDPGSAIIYNVEAFEGKTIAEIKGAAPIITAGSTVSVAATLPAQCDSDNLGLATEGLWYAEFMSFVDAPDWLTRFATIVTPRGLTNSHTLSIINYDNAFERSTSDPLVGDSATGPSVPSTPNQFYKTGVAFSEAETKLRIRAAETWGTAKTNFGGFDYSLVGSGGSFDAVSLGGVSDGDPGAPILYRNIQRWEATYEEAEAKAEELDA